MKRILFLVIVILALYGCAEKKPQTTETGQEVIDETPQQEKTIEVESTGGIEKSLSEELVEKYSAADKEAYFKTKLDEYERICSKITYPKTKNECYIMVAKLKKDIKICEKIDTSAQLTDIDKEDCLATVAYATGDDKICESA